MKQESERYIMSSALTNVVMLDTLFLSIPIVHLEDKDLCVSNNSSLNFYQPAGVPFWLEDELPGEAQ